VEVVPLQTRVAQQHQSPFTTAATSTFKWKITNGTCKDSDLVIIKNYISNKGGTPAATPGTFCNGGGGSDLTQTGGSLGTGAKWQWYSDATYTTKVGWSSFFCQRFPACQPQHYHYLLLKSRRGYDAMPGEHSVGQRYR
jgi:hypothetical protein